MNQRPAEDDSNATLYPSSARNDSGPAGERRDMVLLEALPGTPGDEMLSMCAGRLLRQTVALRSLMSRMYSG